MDITNWIGKPLSQIKDNLLYRRYFDSISLERGIDVWFLLNLEMGIDLILFENYYVKAIHFYSGKKEKTSRYIDNLPFNLDFSFTNNQTRLLLGEPDLSGGGDFSFLYGDTPAWDKYLFENYTLHIQFSEVDKSIDLLTIDSI